MVHRINQLLSALDPVMCDTGGIKCCEDISRIVNLMRDMTKLESRCIYLNLILSTKNEAYLSKFVSAGGWRIMNQWLADVTQCDPHTSSVDSNCFIEDVLRALKILPVTVEILKQNATPRLVKSLSKDPKMGAQINSLASEVVSMWLNVIKSQNENKEIGNNSKDALLSQTEDVKKLPKIPKLANSAKSPCVEPSTDSDKTSEDKGKIKKHSLNVKPDSSSASDLKPSKGSKTETDAKKLKPTPTSASSPVQNSASPDLLTQIKLGMQKTKSNNISLISTTNPDRESNSPPAVNPGSASKTVASNETKTINGKTAVPAKAKPAVRQLSLCDDMFKDTAIAVSPLKKKKKSTVAPTAAKMAKTSSKSSAINQNGSTKAVSPVAKSSCDASLNDSQNSLDSGNPVSSVESQIDSKERAGKRRVRWKTDDDLVKVKVYELDDEERAMKSIFQGDQNQDGVDSIRNSFDIAKQEMLLERKIRLQQNYSGDFNNAKSVSMLWKLVEVTVNCEMRRERGQKSTERIAQSLREKQVFPEIYPNLLTIPLSPKEPDTIFEPRKDPIIIPYDDIEPQGMELDDSDNEVVENTKIIQQGFADVAKITGASSADNKQSSQSISTTPAVNQTALVTSGLSINPPVTAVMAAAMVNPTMQFPCVVQSLSPLTSPAFASPLTGQPPLAHPQSVPLHMSPVAVTSCNSSLPSASMNVPLQRPPMMLPPSFPSPVLPTSIPPNSVQQGQPATTPAKPGFTSANFIPVPNAIPPVANPAAPNFNPVANSTQFQPQSAFPSIINSNGFHQPQNNMSPMNPNFNQRMPNPQTNQHQPCHIWTPNNNLQRNGFQGDNRHKRGTIQCWHFARGHCQHGESCNFKHERANCDLEQKNPTENHRSEIHSRDQKRSFDQNRRDSKSHKHDKSQIDDDYRKSRSSSSEKSCRSHRSSGSYSRDSRKHSSSRRD